MPTLGLDIGGANLKAADTTGEVRSEVFEIWRAPDQLADRLRTLIAHFSRPDALAVTMTAELADCFATKPEGVEFILRQVETVAGNIPVRVWTTAGRFVSPSEGRAQPYAVAAANWHGLATWAGRFVPRGRTLLIDTGSTTTDIIPLVDGIPCPVGRTDVERLRSGELVYTGVRRTPVCAVADDVLLGDAPCPLAAELFATMLDVYLLTGDIPEDPADCSTADGRPATRGFARERLSRMFCCDRHETPPSDIDRAAALLAGLHHQKLAAAISRLQAPANAPPATTALLGGSGSFLLRRILQTELAGTFTTIIPLDRQLTPAIAESACAYALATLLDSL
jgi:(4-(4-[2-(gamma-L-glutamylamino)ethyl]phenoxymethyl)furan-2-yl)methanamine synthase